MAQESGRICRQDYAIKNAKLAQSQVKLEQCQAVRATDSQSFQEAGKLRPYSRALYLLI